MLEMRTGILLLAGVLGTQVFGEPRPDFQIDPEPLPADQPFAPGESASYRAGWGIFGGAGSASLTLVADSSSDSGLLHATLTIRGGIPGARIDERLQSWMQPESLASVRYLQRTRYPRFSRDRERLFELDDRIWTGHTNGNAEQGILPTARPLDELAFLYVVRTMDLSIGHTYTLHGYWRADGNPVRLEVLRREQVRVPAGTYSTIVVRPVIRTSSLFAEGAEAEVYISEGSTREVVLIRAKLSIATLTLRLESFTPGAPSENANSNTDLRAPASIRGMLLPG